MEARKLFRLSKECSYCGGAKTVFISLQSCCTNCGLDPFDIKFEIPEDKINEILAEIASTMKNRRLRSANEHVVVPTYDELVRRLS